MAYAFASITAKPTFGALKENLNQSDYIKRKNAKHINHVSNSYSQKKSNVNSYNNIYSYKLQKCNIKSINKDNLIMGQYTKLDLQNICTISVGPPPTQPCSDEDPCDPCQNNEPVQINANINSPPFYQSYTIDPLGELFGDSQCGKLNYTQKMTKFISVVNRNTCNLKNTSSLQVALTSLYNDVGEQLINLTNLYSLGLNDELNQSMSYDVFISLVKLLSNKYNCSDSYTKLHSIISNSLHGLYKAKIQNMDNNSKIDELQNKINELLNPEVKVFEASTMLKVSAEIKPEIKLYIQEYGLPSGCIFDVDKLGEIIQKLENQNINTCSED